MLYEYQCEKCDEITVVNCLMKDMQRTTTCNSCGGLAIKIISAPALFGVTTTKDRIKREMIKKNDIAGKKCRGSHQSMKLLKD